MLDLFGFHIRLLKTHGRTPHLLCGGWFDLYPRPGEGKLSTGPPPPEQQISKIPKAVGASDHMTSDADQINFSGGSTFSFRQIRQLQSLKRPVTAANFP